MLNAILKTPGDKEKTLEFAYQHFIDTAKEAIDNHGAFYVALSGGSTPKAIFQKFKADDLAWNNVHLFWSDERSVPPTDDDSNYKMAMDSGLGKLVPQENIHRMRAEEDLETASSHYEEEIKRVLNGNSFDLIMLGMGEDGHTASLFPNTKALDVEDQLVVKNFVPQKDSMRMTMTYPLINSAKYIVAYIIGENKKEILAEIVNEGKSFPICKVGSSENKALWIMDQAASSLIKS